MSVSGIFDSMVSIASSVESTHYSGYLDSDQDCKLRFMPADALWTFAMACNVYLTFFYKYDSEQLRRLEWKYFLFCYGLPFIPAFTYFFIESDALGRIYGSAIVSLPNFPPLHPFTWLILHTSCSYGAGYQNHGIGFE